MGPAERGRPRAVLAAVVLAVAVAAVALGPAPARADPLLTCPETPVVHQVCSVATAAPNLAADGAQAVAGGIFDQATKWVVQGAVSVVGFVGKTIDEGTRPDTEAAWFEPNYRLMVSVGVAFLLPLLILAAVWSLLRNDVAGLFKMVGAKLPLAAGGMVVATWVVNMLVAVTDNLSAFAGSSIGGSGEKFGTGVVHLMEAGVLTGNGAGAGALAFLVAVVISLFALVVWIELVVRQAAVLMATLFLPVAFAGMVWESTAHWLRRLAEGLLAFILAKFVITAVVAVGANAVAAGGDNPAALILGAGILAVAAFTPYVLLSIIPLGTVAVAEGLSRRPLSTATSTMSTLYWGQALLGGGGAPGMAGGAGGATGATESGGGPAAGGGLAAAGVAGVGGATAPLAVAGAGAKAAAAGVEAGSAAMGVPAGGAAGATASEEATAPMRGDGDGG